jgi:hypothetical protein
MVATVLETDAQMTTPEQLREFVLLAAIGAAVFVGVAWIAGV